MKNFILLMLSICGGLFVIAFIDAINNDAYSYYELGWMGKISMILFLISFGSIIYFTLLHPYVLWLIKKIKK
jgi:hypothetical protein